MEGLVDVLHRVARATVTISSEIPAEHRSASVLGTSRSGTGCVIDDAGLVLTVNYIVLGANALSVVDIEGRRFDADPVAQDFASGVAVARIRGDTKIPAVRPGDPSSVTRGEGIFIVASAGEGDRRSASGAVSGLEPFDAYWEYRLDRAIWTTCSNPGLGGGLVCNRFGEIVGLASLNLGAVGRATLAIPVDNFFAHAAELLEHGRRISRPRRAWLGVFCTSFPGRTIVAGLVPGAPAEHWGLEVGDVIARVDGTPVELRSELYERIWARDPGDMVEVDVYRDGELVTVPVRGEDVEDFFA